MGRRDSQRAWDGHACAAVFKMGNQHGSPVQSMDLRSVSCSSLNGRRVCRRVDACICMAESLHCLPETITTSNRLYPSTKFKSLMKKKKFLYFKVAKVTPSCWKYSNTEIINIKKKVSSVSLIPFQPHLLLVSSLKKQKPREVKCLTLNHITLILACNGASQE